METIGKAPYIPEVRRCVTRSPAKAASSARQAELCLSPSGKTPNGLSVGVCLAMLSRL